MSLVSAFLETGWIAVFAMAVLWIETAVLSLIAEDKLARFKALAGGALAGSCLLAALGCALNGQGPVWVAGFLTLSFFAHVLDVVSRIGTYPALFKRKTE